MSQLDEAIARYHKILESDSNRDLSWADELQSQMEAEKRVSLDELGLIVPRCDLGGRVLDHSTRRAAHDEQQHGETSHAIALRTSDDRLASRQGLARVISLVTPRSFPEAGIVKELRKPR